MPLVQSNPVLSFPRNTHRPPPLRTSMDPFPQATSQGFEALDSTARKSTNDYLQTQGESPPPFSKKLPTNTLLRAKKRTTSHGRFIRDLIRTSPALIFLSKRVELSHFSFVFFLFLEGKNKSNKCAVGVLKGQTASLSSTLQLPPQTRKPTVIKYLSFSSFPSLISFLSFLAAT